MFLKTETELLVLLVTAISGLPSPSISPAAIPYGAVPVAKSTFVANELEVIDPEKPVLRNIDSVLLVVFETAISGFPSPSKSAMATPKGRVPAVKSTFAAREPEVIDPEVLVFLNTDIEAPLLLVTTISGFPSPSISPMATPAGFVPVVKSTFAEKELLEIVPDVLAFLKTEIVLLPELVTTRSALPSPSISPKAAKYGPVPVVRSTLVARDVASITWFVGNVTLKGVAV